MNECNSEPFELIAGAPQFMEETVEAERLVPSKRVQPRINEQIVQVLLPQNAEDVVQRAASPVREAIEARRAFEVVDE